MPLKLYDTLSRTQRELTPLDGRVFRFYACGPTVYGPAHIGNFRTFVMQDLLRRVLELGGLPTKHVRNLTDVDDKTIRVSQEQGVTLTEFTAHWTKQFHADCEALACLPPHVEPAAAAHIPQQIRMITELMEKGHAYKTADGSVFFKIASFPAYGELSRVKERELQQGISVADDEYEKDSMGDFALWKARKPEDGPNFWPAPWGEGRPGWHLECSAMIREYLGDSFDLHSGGVDLVFPHHENEIAQSVCCAAPMASEAGSKGTGGFAAHWFHITHLLVDGKKMSKSLGNLHTLGDLTAKGYSAAEVRYVLTAAHYRGQLNFTMDSLDGARSALNRLARAEKALAARSRGNISADENNSLPAPAYSGLIGQNPGPFAAAWTALNHDLNTSEALGHLFTTLKSLKPDHLTPEEALEAWQGFHLIMAAFGIHLPEEKTEGIPEEIQTLADARQAARLAKNWAESDRLRARLDDLGWTMQDTRESYSLSKK